MKEQILADPIPAWGLRHYGNQLREGRITALETTRTYLARISSLDPVLQAYQYVNDDHALAAASAIDKLLASGVDLGPLMGVPVSVKDVFRISDFPTPKSGSYIDFADIVGPREAPFITALKRAGAIILGTTKTVELCLGITGVSEPLGTPRNPWDMEEIRVPGGSSSGAAVACAAGMCGFSIGTDSGGSVRVPAAFNGLAGLKTTFGRWPVLGAVPLDPTVDSVGLIGKSVQDVAIAFDVMDSLLAWPRKKVRRRRIDLQSLRIGTASFFSDEAEAGVEHAVEEAEARLKQAGARYVPVAVPEAANRKVYFPVSMPCGILTMLGREGFEKAKARMDRTVAARVERGLDVRAHEYLRLCNIRRGDIETAKTYFDNCDVLATATALSAPPRLSEFDDDARALELALGMTRNTQPANYLEQCAISIPLPTAGSQLPIGYQLIGAAGSDRQLLDVALAVELEFGKPVAPDLNTRTCDCRQLGH